MREQLAKLRELQEIDLLLDEYQTQKKQIQGLLNENKGFVEKLQEDLELQISELEEIKTLRAQKQTDLRDVQEQHSKRKKRLTQVGSTKEYNAVEKEIEVLKRSIEQTEEELLHLAEVIESTQVLNAEKEAKIQALRDSIQSEEKSSEGQIAGILKGMKNLKDREDNARTIVSKRVLHKYDFIRSRRDGQAIVAAKDGHCEGCFMALPAQLYIEVQRGEALVTCPSCQRILYFWEEEAELAAAEG